jgi:hypothetical protein
MKTVAEYRAFAAECRMIVTRASRPEDKQSFEALARGWEHLADEREAHRLLKQKEIDGETAGSGVSVTLASLHSMHY